MQSSIRNIAFAGSGNVACHLAKGLKQQGFRISGIWSRESSHAQELATQINSVAYNEITGLFAEADLIIIAVPDQVIEKVAFSLHGFEGMVVHTAGSVPMDTLKVMGPDFGVFYPLQTFSKEIPVNLAEVPFFIEASSPKVLLALRQVALKLSDKVYNADSRQRLMLHVAAVFTGNYSNLMYIIGNELLAQSGLPPEVLHPLIMATAAKAVSSNPLNVQTGPARRHDTVTIGKHMASLAALPEYAKLYSMLARLISSRYE